MDEHSASRGLAEGRTQRTVCVATRVVDRGEPLDVAIWIPKGTRTPGTPADHREFTINCSDFAAEDWGYLFGLDIYQDRMGNC